MEKGLVYLEGTHSGSLFWRAWLSLASDQTWCPKQSVSILDPPPWWFQPIPSTLTHLVRAPKSPESPQLFLLGFWLIHPTVSASLFTSDFMSELSSSSSSKPESALISGTVTNSHSPALAFWCHLGLVRAPQRNRTNRMCIFKKIYYTKLAHAIIETKMSLDLQGHSAGRLEPQGKPMFQFESKGRKRPTS